MREQTAAPDTFAGRRHWLFDMDGTLTLAMHDFDAMRRELDLPAGVPILEALDAMTAGQARDKRRALDEMELRMAHEAQEQPGATALLEGLAAQGVSLGIVTRNGRDIADATLTACGLSQYFHTDAIVSRDCAPPKPGPEGIQLVLERWDALPSSAVMVGDYRFDLEAGQRAGCRTVHVNVDNGETWPEYTDACVTSLFELADLVLR